MKDQKNIIPNAGSKEVLFSIDGSSDYELLVPKTVYPPREDSTLSFMNYGAYLIGGMNYHVEPEISHIVVRNSDKNNLDDLVPVWE